MTIIETPNSHWAFSSQLKPLPLRLIQGLYQGKFMVDLIDQIPKVHCRLDRLIFEALAQMRQAHRAEVATAALEAMGNASQRLGIVPGLAQRFDTLLGIIEEGVEQLGVLAFHDFLQTRQHVRVQMHINHLLAP